MSHFNDTFINPDQDEIPTAPFRRNLRGTTTCGTLDPKTAEKLKKFYNRNAEAIEQENDNKNDSEGGNGEMDLTADIVADKFDVFSPDVRSTRWKEFQELLLSAKGTELYEKLKKAAAGVRGTNKAMTVATGNPIDLTQLGKLH